MTLVEPIGGHYCEDHFLTLFMEQPPKHIGEWVSDYVERFYEKWGRKPEAGWYGSQFPVEVRPIYFKVRRK